VSEEDVTQEPEARTVLDQLLDRFVYAPLEIMSEASQNVESTAQRGRERFSLQARNARVLGQMVVGFGANEVGRCLKSVGILPPDQATEDSPEPPAAEAAEPVPEAPLDAIDHLIANYADLSASQVIRLLENFTPAELAEIERYEKATRGRTTIVNRIHQLEPKDEPES
jgi:hypothetical protein